jgi:Domain of unknown function (DUF4136)
MAYNMPKNGQEDYAMKKVYSLFLLFLLGGGVCSYAAEVTTDYDHSANFSQYKTYSWLKVQAGDSLWANRIQQDVDAQLATRGWTKVATNGDASVSAFESTQDQTSLETFYDGFGGGRWRGFGGMGTSTTTTEVTRVGTVVVDIFDTQKQQLIWRGKESGDLSGHPDRNAKNLAKNLASLFKRFPPSK